MSFPEASVQIGYVRDPSYERMEEPPQETVSPDVLSTEPGPKPETTKIPPNTVLMSKRQMVAIAVLAVLVAAAVALAVAFGVVYGVTTEKRKGESMGRTKYSLHSPLTCLEIASLRWGNVQVKKRTGVDIMNMGETSQRR